MLKQRMSWIFEEIESSLKLREVQDLQEYTKAQDAQERKQRKTQGRWAESVVLTCK